MKEQKLMVSVIIPVYNNEDYLKETLQSLEKQSYKEFEVIVVNDGSTDKSESIIDQFVKKDKRFHKISQKNSGVSAARNAALETAKGRYITFADGDDMLPEEALKKMAETALKTEADLIIGGMKRMDGFSEKINQRTENLKYKKEIKKDDLDLVHGLSLCNKWFLREIVEKHHLRLENFRHLEDAVFLYQFLQYGEKIRYCDAIIYEYWKRIPTNGGSVTQRVEKGLLESAIGAYERLKQLTAGYSEEFQQELAYRINSTTLIGDYYKKIWSLDAETEALLISYAGKILREQPAAYRKRTIASHPGLELEKGLKTKEELLKECLFTIVIGPNVSKEYLNIILRSIYGQAVAAFHVIVDASCQEFIEEDFQKKENLIQMVLGKAPKDWMKTGMKNAGKYVLFLNQDVLLDHDTLSKVYQLFQKKCCHTVRINIVSSEKRSDMTGLVFDSSYLDTTEGREFLESELLLEKFLSLKKRSMQKEAPLIAIKDMEYRKELMEPAMMEKIFKKAKEKVKQVFRIFSILLHRS